MIAKLKHYLTKDYYSGKYSAELDRIEKEANLSIAQQTCLDHEFPREIRIRIPFPMHDNSLKECIDYFLYKRRINKFNARRVKEFKKIVTLIKSQNMDNSIYSLFPDW